MDGYIKLHRRILESAVFDNPVLFKIWAWCLLRAAYQGHDCVIGRQKVRLEPGQFIYGRIQCSEQLKMSQSTLNTYLHMLEGMGSLTIAPNTKFSVITVCNWAMYQSGEMPDQTDWQMDNKKTTNQTTDQTTNELTKEKQTDTNKKEKKGKKEKNPTVDQLLSFLEDQEPNEELREALGEFVRYRAGCAPLTLLSLSKARERLAELSGGDAATARAIVNQSIVSGWKGLFAVKGSGHAAPQGGIYEQL